MFVLCATMLVFVGIWSSQPTYTTLVSDEDPDKIIGVVPPSEAYGVSLWGDMGDAEGVLCIFEISIKSGKVKTYNICS